MLNKFVLTLLIGSSAMLAGCNTVAGAGADISAGGHAIERAAESAK